MKTTHSGEAATPNALFRRHLRVGWSAILVFAALGIALEVLHGLKVDAYVNLANETRRLMWTLAHAHGVLLGLVQLAFAFTARALALTPDGWPRYVSPSLNAATLLLPSGFFLGGVVTYGGDPGLGILLVPVGAAFLLGALLTIALRAKPRV
jgi:hypothetical protein